MSCGHSSSCHHTSFTSLLQTQILEKRSNTGPGLQGCLNHVVSAGARGSDATTLRLWVSQEESVLLQRGCGWLQGSRPAPRPKPTAQRQEEILSLCIHCLLFTLLCAPPSGPHKGPSQASHPWPLASPFPLLQLRSCPHYKHLFPFA